MPEGYAFGWSYIPHFIHVRFYTYAYSFAQLVALLLYRRYREDPEAFAPSTSSCSRPAARASPADLVAPFGLDLRSTDTWREAFEELDALRVEAETLDAGASTRSRARSVGLASSVLDLLLPQRCLVCGAAGRSSARTAARLPRLTPPLCERCGAPTAWPVGAAASARPAARVRHRARRGRLERASAGSSPPGRSTACAASADERRRWSPSGCRGRRRALVTFVPADAGRRLERGYHPAQRLAEALARALGAAVRALPRARAAVAPPAGALARRAAAERSRAFARAARRRRRGASSTTSTRAARRRMRPPRRSRGWRRAGRDRDVRPHDSRSRVG